MPVFTTFFNTTQAVNSGNNVFNINSTGDVNGDGIAVTGSADVTFAGTLLSASDGIEVTNGNTTSDIVVSGTIDAASEGILIDAFDRVTVSGTVTSGAEGVEVKGGGQGGNAILVTSSGNVTSQNDAGIILRDPSNELIIAGTVAGMTGSTNGSGVEVVNEDNRISVSGNVFSNGGTGIDVFNSADDTDITVSGTVTALGDDGIRTAGLADRVHINVSGSVEGRQDGIAVFGTRAEVNVSGNVVGGVGNDGALSYGIFSASSNAEISVGAGGYVYGDNAAVQITSTNNDIVLAGTIQGQDRGLVLAAGSNGATVVISGQVDSQEGEGILIEGSANQEILITQTGVVTGSPEIDDEDQGEAIEINSITGQGNTIYNAGLISAGGDSFPFGTRRAQDAINDASGNLTLVNTGIIDGDVELNAGSDIYNASGGSGTVFGEIDLGSGNDRYFGGMGDARVDGGSGEDFFVSGSGNETINGGSSTDVMDYSGNTSNLRVSLGFNIGLGEDIGVDRLTSIEVVLGGRGDDRLANETGNVSLFGGDGDDDIGGGTGNEILSGDDGDDIIVGFAGFDTIEGGAGNDTLEGRFNADTFVYDDGFGNDTITDFDANNINERIDFTQHSAVNNFGDLTVAQQGGNTLITVSAGQTILLEGVAAGDIAANDFIF
ncbi:MAG: calcium-binding protein [Pseudomonadota bacterium]